MPPVTDNSFWGNWDNSDWKSWIDLRFDIAGNFYEELRKALPDNFILTGCGVPSASVKALMDGADARTFLRGWNYVNMELVGNTPPYKKDKLTINHPIPERFVNSSHHQNVARSQGVRTFCTGFAHSTIAANHVWATAKAMNADAWIGTLKTRLGLPWHILNTLPSEENIVGEAFGFEAKHPELFEGDLAPQLGVYFSYETRNHTLYGNLEKGYYKDYGDVLTLLFKEGITPHTIFEIPKKPDVYPVIVLSGVALMTEQEKDRLQTYLHNGGKIVALGPTCIDNCENSWRLPNQVNASPESFFSTVPDGIHVKMPEWVTKTEVEAPTTSAEWQMPQEGLYYHAQRLCDANRNCFLQLIRQYMKPLPITFVKVEGYLVSVLQNQNHLTIHLLAEDYDVDIDHELDSMRTHRSRINLLSEIVAKNVDPVVELKTDKEPVVYTPFNNENSSVSFDGCSCKICLPKHCSYAIIKF